MYLFFLYQKFATDFNFYSLEGKKKVHGSSVKNESAREKTRGGGVKLSSTAKLLKLID